MQQRNYLSIRAHFRRAGGVACKMNLEFAPFALEKFKKTNYMYIMICPQGNSRNFKKTNYSSYAKYKQHPPICKTRLNYKYNPIYLGCRSQRRKDRN